MKDFIYVGSVDSAATIDEVDVIFWKGSTVTLPENNDYVKSLIAQGFLIDPPVTAETVKPKEGK